MSIIYFLAHPEVLIDPQVPVPQWPLSDIGRARMESFCERATWLSELTRLMSSAETEALDGAKIIQRRYALALHADSQFNELDRSATGYLSKAEHGVSSVRPRSPIRRLVSEGGKKPPMRSGAL